MGYKKLVRFAAIKQFEHVFEYANFMKGKWHEWFKNQNPIVLELACGKGEYTVGLASLYANLNLIGVDIKGNRIYIGASQCLQRQLTNAAFLRTQIDWIDQYFDANEVSEIWITFPDPQLRFSRAKKRLTHPNFLRKYQTFLKSGAKIHLKTDSPVLYQFTMGVVAHYGCTLHKQYTNLYSQATEPSLINIKTHYESLDIAKSGTIFYVCFSLPERIDPSMDVEFMEWAKQLELGFETNKVKDEPGLLSE